MKTSAKRFERIHEKSNTLVQRRVDYIVRMEPGVLTPDVTDDDLAIPVMLRKRIAIAVRETTYDEWALCVAAGACTERPDNGWGKGKRPVINVSWNDARTYARWMSEKTGLAYRLPTETEWEYAARGGTSTPYWWGEKFDRARVATNAPSAVGSYAANAFGLYDVLGNAREWVADCYVNNYVNAPTDGAPVRDGDCGKRVIRGGAWSSAPADMRVANRSRIDTGVSARYMGFRTAAEIE